MKIGYVTTPYFGKRNTIHSSLVVDQLFYVKKHIEYLNRQSAMVDKVYLICTFDDNLNQSNVLNILDNLYELTNDDSRIIIETRENYGASYASWKYGLHMDSGTCDYMILAEDDYCLYDDKSAQIMLEYFQNDIDLFYLCQVWDTKPYKSSVGIIPAHAGLGSGMIDNKKYHKLRIESNLDFRIIRGNTYQSYYDTQSNYLEDYRLNNLKIMDWTEKHSSIFAYGEGEFGNVDGSKIFIPIVENFIN
jgi:hypothetical protein